MTTMPSDSTSTPGSSAVERAVVGSLPSAILLAMTGGSLDAFIYLNHGHVFAAAQTGNGVLLGVTVLQHDWHQTIRHLLPMGAFISGVFTARFFDETLKSHAVLVGLLCEVCVLFAFSWLPQSFPDSAFVPLIAFVAAYQVGSFRKVNAYSYNSTFMTGNLRTAVDGLYESLHVATRSEGLRKFRELCLIIAGFLAGAAIGAILSPGLLNHTLWIIELPLVLVVALTVWRDRENQSHKSKRMGSVGTSPPAPFTGL